MSGNTSADEAPVRAFMSAYEAALNASDTEAVMPLYADDGVFMPQNSQSAVGKAAVRQAYDMVFKAITLKVKFRRNGLTCGGIPRERKRSTPPDQRAVRPRASTTGKWQIARYSFSTTNLM
jgi:hypothetical protein